jgi:hypothetical protein
MPEQAQALLDLPASIAPLVRRHVQDAAFYWKQLRYDDVPVQVAQASEPSPRPEPHLSPTKREAFAQLLSAHLDGIREAGADAWPPALEALRRWRKASEAYAAGWAVLSAALSPANAESPSPAWGELWHTLRAQRAHWDTLLPALHDAWQAATTGPDAWPGAAQPLNAALEALSPALRAVPLQAHPNDSASDPANAQRSAWCAAMEIALSTASPTQAKEAQEP